MTSQNNSYTFDSLSRLSRPELDQIMLTGTAPQIGDLLGYEFRGWNLQRATELLGTRKFKKGFFGDPAHPYAWGYNVPVQQNAETDPWISKPGDDDPRRYFFFKVLPAATAHQPRYTNSLVIDYRQWDEYFFLNPVRFTVDYLVYPDPGNQDLILGKSYLEMGPFRPFLGYFVLDRYNQSGYGRTSHFLSERELRTLRAYTDVFLESTEAVIPPQDVVWNVDRYLERVESNRTRSLKLLLFLIEYVLPRRSLWPFRPPFSRMALAARKRFVETRLANSKNPGPLRHLTRIQTLFIVGYYGDPRVHESVHFIPVRQRSRYGPGKLKPLGRPHLALEEPSRPEIECDVCVIGSGAGGAVVAYHAAAAGKDVVLLEEGRYLPSSQMTHQEWEMMPRLYKEGGLQTTVDLGLAILQGKCLGGSTTINNAICFRLNDPGLSSDASAAVLRDWPQLGAHIDWARLDSAFDRVEQMIGVRPLLETQEQDLPPISGGNARVLLDGWAALVAQDPDLGRYQAGLFRKNYDRCLGCGYCNFGCPYERKLSMIETYIPQAIERGARVITECHAVKIETNGRQATGVLCRRPGGQPLLVKARSVVVACGAIGSSVLLMKSGAGGNVGRRFSFNAGSTVFALFPEPLQAFDGVQMGAYVEGEDFLLESLFYPPMAFAAALPGWSLERMRAYDRFACAGALIGTEANGRVNRTSLWRSLFGPVDYRMTAADLQKLKRALARLVEIYFAAGAERVYPGAFAAYELDAGRFAANPGAIFRFLDEHIRRPDDLILGSAHPQGGNPMSDDPATGVVDSQFRVHGYDNLFVCDASVFPTTIRINPQLTIMAMADYFAHLDVL